MRARHNFLWLLPFLLAAAIEGTAWGETAPDAGWLARARNQLAAREYQASPTRRGLQAPNRAQNLRTYFEPTGVRVVDRTAPGSPLLASLRLAFLGRGERRHAVGPGEVTHRGPRVEIARPGLDLVEWFENGPDGLEQGLTLAARPAGTGPLVAEVRVEGARVLLKDGEHLQLHSAAGRRLEYGALHVEDARGTTLSAHLALSDHGFEIVVVDASAVYPVVIDPLLTADYDHELESNQIDAYLGRGVASAGDVNGDGYDDVVVGAYGYDLGETFEGAAFIFHGGPDGIGDGNPSNADTVVQSNQTGARLGFVVAGAGDVNGDGYDDVVIGADLWESSGAQAEEGCALLLLGSAGGIPDADPTTADALFQSNQAGANLGLGVAGAGDVNGDGYGDLLIGAPNYDAPSIDEGAVFVYLGSAAGIASGDPTSADASLESDQAGAQLGFNLAGAGDLDADGYDDVIAAAALYDHSGLAEQGLALVFHGSATGVASGGPGGANSQIRGSQAFARLGSGVDGAGDVNGDGYGDVIVGAYLWEDGTMPTDAGGVFLFHGGPFGIGIFPTPALADGTLKGSQAGSLLGWSVAGAGDVNGDGYADVIVGEHGADLPSTNEGAAHLVLGSAAGVGSGFAANLALATVEGDQTDAAFGVDVASAGDVNGDGFADVIVGAHTFDGPQTDEGQAFVFHGGGLGIADGDPSSAHAQLESDQALAQLGSSVASAGDVNGDGFGDIIIGAVGYDAGELDEGAAFVFLGSASGIPDADPAMAHAQLESDQEGARFGASVASAGDVNGDGFGDVIVGAERYDAGETNEGAAFVFLGSAIGIADADPGTAHGQLESDQEGASFGGSVASAGDVDGDGFGDVIVGAESYDAGETNEGAAFVFLGSATGIANGDPGTAHAQFESDGPGAGLGVSVASAGDVDGDGFGDVIVGAESYDAGETNEGAAFVFLGSATGLADADPGTAHAQLESNQESSFFGYSVASAGDVNGDGYADVIVGALDYDSGEDGEGAAFVFLGSATGIADANPGTAHAQLESDQESEVGGDPRFGQSVAAAGDVNGDGFGDVIVGAPAYDLGAGDSGAAFVFLGSAAGIAEGDPATVHTQLTSAQNSASFGLSVAAAGDVNGDGFGDVIVGAYDYDDDEISEGAAFVFLGSESDRPTQPRQLRGDATGIPVEPGGRSLANDAFAVELTVTSPRGRERARLEVEACPAGLPFGDPGCTLTLSPTWVDLGLAGAVLGDTVTGLSPGALYHWRARPLYVPLSATEPGITPIPRPGPWRRIAGGGGTEDIRALPEPGALMSLCAGVLLLCCLPRTRRRGRRLGPMLAAVAAIAAAVPADASLIAVVGDLGTQHNDSFYDAVLGPQTKVLFSRFAGNLPTLRTHFDEQPGVSAFESAAELDASLLASVDLLVVTTTFNTMLDYSGDEIDAVRQFLDDGGSLLMVTEFNPILFPPSIYNDFLAGIGSEIRYDGGRVGTLESLAPEDTPLTAGLDDFHVAAYNTLSGGVAAYVGSGGTVVAYEGSVVPEPSTGALMLFGLAGWAALGRPRRREASRCESGAPREAGAPVRDHSRGMERETGVEPATPSLGSSCSTN